ncbi:hypothetical protein DCC81_15630 [Chitinophaga parva]|uniref:VCBS repeat-containing protein n=2 Tax=Chitinophaga parva TaxID=2169414 RepID=A0A2T7BHE2_9BACT|nr:hypothetical protein DCC81_15630 [Chitinophaga parva]
MRYVLVPLAGFVMACNSPVTKHNDQQTPAQGVPPAAAGDSSWSSGTPDNENVTQKLTFNREDYTIKAMGTRLAVVITAPGKQLPDSVSQPGFTGILYNAAIADLDHDHQPEIYAFTRSGGQDNYRSVFALAMRSGRSYPIKFTDLSPATNGYAGQDTFYIDNAQRRLVRQYPVTDSSSKRVTNATRTIKYSLVRNGDMYELKP